MHELRKGLKSTSSYSHLVDKAGGGRPLRISERGGRAGPPMWIFFFYNIIIKCQNVVREKGGGSTNAKKDFCMF